MDELPDDARDLLARQDGVASRSQLLRCGVTAEQWRWNAGRTWRVLLPRVVMLGRAEPRPRQRLVAGLIWAGPDSVLAAATAARWHGITSAGGVGAVDLLVPRPARSRTAGFAHARRTVLHDPDVVRRGPLRVSSAARAAVDAAVAARSPAGASAVLVEAVQRRIASLDDIAEWVHRVRPPADRGLAGALAHAATGAWSRPEAQLVDLLRTSSVLPTPWMNPRLETDTGDALLTPDAWFDDVALAVMVHSFRYHGQGDAWDETVDGDTSLTTAGIVVVAVTPRRLCSDPARTLQRIEAGYAVARARPRPRVVAEPRDPWATSAA